VLFKRDARSNCRQTMCAVHQGNLTLLRMTNRVGHDPANLGMDGSDHVASYVTGLAASLIAWLVVAIPAA
jgi:hypothetical protein